MVLSVGDRVLCTGGTCKGSLGIITETYFNGYYEVELDIAKDVERLYGDGMLLISRIKTYLVRSCNLRLTTELGNVIYE